MKEFFILQLQVSNALFYYLKKMSSYLRKIWIRIRINLKSGIRICIKSFRIRYTGRQGPPVQYCI